MVILSLESSAGPASCAVYRDEDMLAYSYTNNGLTHSKTLMSMVENAMRSAGLEYSDLQAVAVSVGPGSFTGLRIGVSIVKGIAWASELLAIPVSSLESMAFGAAHMGMPICAVMDARCGQVYNALFDVVDGVPVRTTEDRAISMEELAEELKKRAKNYVIVGDGSKLCYNYLESVGLFLNTAPSHVMFQSACGVALAALKSWNNNGAVKPGELKPVYLRLPQAERERIARLGS